MRISSAVLASHFHSSSDCLDFIDFEGSRSESDTEAPFENLSDPLRRSILCGNKGYLSYSYTAVVNVTVA